MGQYLNSPFRVNFIVVFALIIMALIVVNFMEHRAGGE